MKLKPITRQRIYDSLEATGTNAKTVAKIRKKLKANRQTAYMAKGKKFTAIIIGDNIGMAKRATYADMADDYNEDRAIAICISRMWGKQ